MKKNGLFLGFFWALVVQLFAQTPVFQVLVFSKTAGFRHQSIGAGKTALTKMATEKGFKVQFTEDARLFQEATLKPFHAVIFLNTTGDVLNPEQQTAFERYIQAGGGYVGIHAATDTEYDWAWYGELAGAYFLDHPNPDNVQKGKFVVTQKNHWATQGMPDSFEKTDEFYNFKNISPQIKVVLSLDEASYRGGKNGASHPMSWYQAFDGGRSFYTALGHTDETFVEPLFLNHLWAGIRYAAGGDAPKSVDFSQSRPEENRFTKVVLEEKLNEPIELSVLNDGRILFIERHGAVRLYNLQTKTLKTIANIPVSTKYNPKNGKADEAEDGLMGLNKDPNFAQNHWIYLYYSAPEASKNILTRYELNGDELVMDSKKVLLEVPVQRDECCHTGGSIAWDAAGNLYLSTGDNTNPHASDGFSPSDERPDRAPWDAQKSSANTNDLRGKIIRIKPTPEGGYMIPEGNLFPKGMAKTRPEIYTMGHRNPYRISVDAKTNYVYWGEVGPDANKPVEDRGPAGHDEVGQARKAGNFGWPHFVGDNKAYHKYDFEAKKVGEKWLVEKPTNTSPHNTGLTVLPPAEKAMIWYPYGDSKEFPLVGSGGRNAMAGPVFYKDAFAKAERSFPSYYDGKLLAYEWMRGWIMAVSMDKDGNYQRMERFMPSYKFSNPMDMEFAANGDLYMLEYGSGWFTGNDDARLIRIEYNGGNRKPLLKMGADKISGSIPFKVALNAQGTMDADGDLLQYVWQITAKNGFSKTFKIPNPTLTLKKAGIYTATLTVTDSKGGVNSQSFELTAGNEPPVVHIDMSKNNKTFYFPNQPFAYKINVSDKEDGSVAKGSINPEQVSVTIDYLAEGFDKVAIAQGHRSADATVKGLKLIAGSDCKSCHNPERKSIGPSYFDIAAKYKGNAGALENLTKKVISGASGVWGETAMAAHPQLSTADAAEMVQYILSFSEKAKESKVAIQGDYTPKLPANDKGQGIYVLRAAYADQGANGLPSCLSEQSVTLRNAKLGAHDFDKYDEMMKMTFGDVSLSIASKSNSYMVLQQTDLKNIVALDINAMAPKPQANCAGGDIEIHLDAPTGPLIGSFTVEVTEKMDTKQAAKPIRLKIAPTNGIHDLYMVFKNPKADGRSLMVVTGMTFLNQE
jgi:cytochrome c